MELLKMKLTLGAEAPFRILHMSDTHLYLADERDNERKRQLAVNRSRHFTTPEENLAAGVQVARENHAVIMYSGDLIDFVSEANLDAAKTFTDENDCFMAAGNHEFSLYVGEAFEDAAYREQSLSHVQESFKNDIRFAARVINGVNFVAIDNSYYLIDEWQLDRLKEECRKGMPVVLIVHTPLYAEDLAAECHARNTEALYLMDAPESELATYSEYRYRQQKADAVTHEAMEYIKSEPVIRAILTGHLHYAFTSHVTDTLTQYMVGTDSMRLIEIE